MTGSATPRPPGRWLLAVPVALLAGLVSFFSPCVIPLLPGYLSYATGLSGADLADARPSGAAGCSPARCCSCSASRSSSSRLGTPVRRAGRLAGRPGATRSPSCSACSTIVLGLVFAGPGCRGCSATGGCTRCPPSGWPPRRCSASSSASAGRPCIGPTLAAITTLSLNEATAGRGALLLGGLRRWGWACRSSSPALAYRRALGAFAFVRRHQAWVTRVGGLMLVAGRRAAGHRLVGPGRSSGCRSTWSPPVEVTRVSASTDERPEGHVDSDAATTGAPHRAPLRRADRPRAAALDLAPAHLDAHRAGAAAPARAGRDPGLADPAGAASTRSRPRSWQDAHPQLTPVYEKLGLFSSTTRRGSRRSTSC